jgi:hypothetical protein
VRRAPVTRTVTISSTVPVLRLAILTECACRQVIPVHWGKCALRKTTVTVVFNRAAPFLEKAARRSRLNAAAAYFATLVIRAARNVGNLY